MWSHIARLTTDMWIEDCPRSRLDPAMKWTASPISRTCRALRAELLFEEDSRTMKRLMEDYRGFGRELDECSDERRDGGREYRIPLL